MQKRQVKKQTELVNYQELEEGQSQSNAQNQENSNAPKSQAQGSLIFQLEPPKMYNLQVNANQYIGKDKKASQEQKAQIIQNANADPFHYEIEMVSEMSQQLKYQTQPQTVKQQKANLDKNKQRSKAINEPNKNYNQTAPIQEETREKRLNRRRNKSGFKDIFNGSQADFEKGTSQQEAIKTNQAKNIEYGKSQLHSQSQNQRTDIPLKQQALTAQQRLQVIKQQKTKQNKKIKLQPIKKPKKKRQNQEPTFPSNDSSIMALDKLAQSKGKTQNRSAQTSYQSTVFNKFAFKPAARGTNLKFMFKRQKICMQNYYYPQFSLVFNETKLIFSARKQCGHINSHYNITCQQKNYSKQGRYYAGYLIGNFLGTRFNIFSYNHSASQLIATIVYKAEFGCTQLSFRKFSIYVKNEDYAYNELAGFVQGQNIDLQELYQVSDNARAKKIIKLVNKQPEWCSSLNAFTMNFKGKLKMASVKNMILVQEGNQRQNVLMLCKDSQNEFYLQIGDPLSPFMAIGIVLSGFDFKLCCQ